MAVGPLSEHRQPDRLVHLPVGVVVHHFQALIAHDFELGAQGGLGQRQVDQAVRFQVKHMRKLGWRHDLVVHRPVEPGGGIGRGAVLL